MHGYNISIHKEREEKKKINELSVEVDEERE